MSTPTQPPTPFGITGPFAIAITDANDFTIECSTPSASLIFSRAIILAGQAAKRARPQCAKQNMADDILGRYFRSLYRARR
jgi:hypothetical protein